MQDTEKLNATKRSEYQKTYKVKKVNSTFWVFVKVRAKEEQTNDHRKISKSLKDL